MLKVYITLILWLTISQFSFSQNRCSANEYNQYLENKLPEIKEARIALEEALTLGESAMKKAETSEHLIRIPVVIHIIHNDINNQPGTSGSTNISDEQVYSQIRVLNEDFRRLLGTNGFNDDPVGADTEVEFCLATRDTSGYPTSGINRIYNSKGFWSMSEDAQLKALSYWPSDQYLNIWVANLSAEIIGYAQFPYGSVYSDLNEGPSAAETDGVVLDYKAFGTTGTATSPFHLGRTCSHEIGHWLGLRHLWDIRADTCGDDGVMDTPVDDRSNNDNDCVDSSYCGGKWGHDMARNYMDYSIDACFNIFTLGQKERIRAVMSSAPLRVGILSSQGCAIPLNTYSALDAAIYFAPNPAVNQVELHGINHLSGNCKVMNVSGNVIMEESLREDNVIDISALSSGIYFFHIQFKEGTLVRKVVKL